MKKIISMFLVCVLSLSFVACGEISPAENNGEETRKPAKVEYTKYDTSTEEGLEQAIINAPDNNAKDGFWEYLIVKNLKGEYTKNALPINYEGVRYGAGYSEEIYDEEKTASYGEFYIDHVNNSTGFHSGSINNDEDKAFYSNVFDSIPIDKFYQKLGIEFDKLIFEENVNRDIIFTKWEDTLEVKKELHGEESEDYIYYKDVLTIQNSWTQNCGEWFLESNSKIYSDLYNGTTSNMNHRNDWFKYQGLEYDIWSTADYKLGKATHPFKTEEEGAKCIELDAMFKELGKNYIEAKFLGTELTTKLSDDFAAVADIERTREYLEVQGLTTDKYDFEVYDISSNFFQPFPQVNMSYRLTDKETGVSANAHCVIFFKNVKTDNGFDYEIEYILDFKQADVQATEYYTKLYNGFPKLIIKDGELKNPTPCINSALDMF